MMTDTQEIIKDLVKDRYPGIRPFKKGESELFFGRNTEVEELLHSIKVHDTLVLYSKSGLGKSSLVNAGLIPRLLEENIFPIDIRFLSTEESPYQKIISEVKACIPEEVLSAIPETFRENLWVLLNHWHRNETPVLIFDQFEEFFYYSQAMQAETISK
ncbi:MAG: hypothetical protein EOO02_23650, partial [Chitinophagaceae bacterium]